MGSNHSTCFRVAMPLGDHMVYTCKVRKVKQIHVCKLDSAVTTSNNYIVTRSSRFSVAFELSLSEWKSLSFEPNIPLPVPDE